MGKDDDNVPICCTLPGKKLFNSTVLKILPGKKLFNRTVLKILPGKKITQQHSSKNTARKKIIQHYSSKNTSISSYNIRQDVTIPQSSFFSLQCNESNQKEQSREQACVRHRTSIYFGFCILNNNLSVLSTKINVVNMSVYLFSLCLC
jgi:hypothetical protein